MSKKKEKTAPETEAAEVKGAGEAEAAQAEAESRAGAPGSEPEEPAEETSVVEQVVPKDQFLRLAAEYDNYRKRTAKEKENLWTEAKADTVQAFLPVYDNLDRAMKQETADEAYKKGVEIDRKSVV